MPLVMEGEGLVPVAPAQAGTARYACETHTEAGPTDRAPVGVCYDADRLNLWRLGIRPEPKYLSTRAGINMASAGAIQTLHYDPLTWADVLDELGFS